jgi:hypothetical protein
MYLRYWLGMPEVKLAPGVRATTRSGAGGPDDLGKLAPQARMTTIL